MNGILHLVGLAPLTFAGAAAMTFGAAFVRGLTGFGMAIILVPLLGMLMPPGQAVVLGIILQLLIGPVGFRRIASDADRRTALPIALLAMLATPLGMLALKAVTPDVARLLIAIIAIGAFLLILMPQHPDGHQPGRGAIGATGVASGLATGKLFTLSLLLFIPMVLGDQVGARLFGRVPVPVWRSIVAVVLGAAGISALVRLLS